MSHFGVILSLEARFCIKPPLFTKLQAAIVISFSPSLSFFPCRPLLATIQMIMMKVKVLLLLFLLGSEHASCIEEKKEQKEVSEMFQDDQTFWRRTLLRGASLSMSLPIPLSTITPPTPAPMSMPNEPTAIAPTALPRLP